MVIIEYSIYPHVYGSTLDVDTDPIITTTTTKLPGSSPPGHIAHLLLHRGKPSQHQGPSRGYHRYVQRYRSLGKLLTLNQRQHTWRERGGGGGGGGGKEGVRKNQPGWN